MSASPPAGTRTIRRYAFEVEWDFEYNRPVLVKSIRASKLKRKKKPYTVAALHYLNTQCQPQISVFSNTIQFHSSNSTSNVDTFTNTIHSNLLNLFLVYFNKYYNKIDHMSIDLSNTYNPQYPWSNKEHFIINDVKVHHKELRAIKNIHMNNGRVFKYFFSEYISDDNIINQVIDLSFQYLYTKDIYQILQETGHTYTPMLFDNSKWTPQYPLPTNCLSIDT